MIILVGSLSVSFCGTEFLEV